MNFIIHPDADVEFYDAVGYYDQQADGLGKNLPAKSSQPSCELSMGLTPGRDFPRTSIAASVEDFHTF